MRRVWFGTGVGLDHRPMLVLMLPDGSRVVCVIYDMNPGLDLCCTDPAQHLITADQDLDDFDDIYVGDLSEPGDRSVDNLDNISADELDDFSVDYLDDIPGIC